MAGVDYLLGTIIYIYCVKLDFPSENVQLIFERNEQQDLQTLLFLIYSELISIIVSSPC